VEIICCSKHDYLSCFEVKGHGMEVVKSSDTELLTTQLWRLRELGKNVSCSSMDICNMPMCANACIQMLYHMMMMMIAEVIIVAIYTL